MNNHNQNIHTVTHYRPIDLLRNTDEEVYNEVLSNIKKFKYSRKDINEDKIKIGNHIIIKNNCIKSNKRLITRKMRIRSDKVIGTISNIFSHGLYSIIVDENATPNVIKIINIIINISFFFIKKTPLYINNRKVFSFL